MNDYHKALDSINAWRPSLDVIRIVVPEEIVSYPEENVTEMPVEAAAELWKGLGAALGYTFGEAK